MYAGWSTFVLLGFVTFFPSLASALTAAAKSHWVISNLQAFVRRFSWAHGPLSHQLNAVESSLPVFTGDCHMLLVTTAHHSSLLFSSLVWSSSGSIKGTNIDFQLDLYKDLCRIKRWFVPYCVLLESNFSHKTCIWRLTLSALTPPSSSQWQNYKQDWLWCCSDFYVSCNVHNARIFSINSIRVQYDSKCSICLHMSLPTQCH